MPTRKLYKKICSVCNKRFLSKSKENKACPKSFCQKTIRIQTINKRLPRKIKKIIENSRILFLRMFESEVEIKEGIAEIKGQSMED